MSTVQFIIPRSIQLEMLEAAKLMKEGQRIDYTDRWSWAIDPLLTLLATIDRFTTEDFSDTETAVVTRRFTNIRWDSYMTTRVRLERGADWYDRLRDSFTGSSFLYRRKFFECLEMVGRPKIITPVYDEFSF